MGLIGVLVEVVSVVSSVEIEQLSVQNVREQMQHIFNQMDCDTSSSISRAEFQSLLCMPEAAQTIRDVGVDVVGLVDFAEIIFPDDNELGFVDFMDIILQFPGTNTATVRDLVELR